MVREYSFRHPIRKIHGAARLISFDQGLQSVDKGPRVSNPSSAPLTCTRHRPKHELLGRRRARLEAMQRGFSDYPTLSHLR